MVLRHLSDLQKPHVALVFDESTTLKGQVSPQTARLCTRHHLHIGPGLVRDFHNKVALRVLYQVLEDVFTQIRSLALCRRLTQVHGSTKVINI